MSDSDNLLVLRVGFVRRVRYDATPAEVGKDDVAKTGSKQPGVILRAEPDQVLYFRVCGSRAF